MKTCFKILFLCVAIVGFSSCSLDDDEFYSSDLIGSWNWQSTAGGEANHIFETPENLDKHIELRLLENNSFIVLENESKIAEGSYQLKNKISTLTEEHERFISVTIKTTNDLKDINYEGVIYTYNKGNILVIKQDFEDGLTSVFRKID